MKIERGRNDYELVNYDEANNKKNNKPHSSPQTSRSTLDELKMSFKHDQHTIHYLAIDIIKIGYTKIQDSIDEKKYKTLSMTILTFVLEVSLDLLYLNYLQIDTL